MNKKITEKIRESLLYFDGGFGSMLIEHGLLPGENSAEWNITHPDTVLDIHKMYIKSGANVITSNTFGANPLKMRNYAECVKSGLELANTAAAESLKENVYVAFDIGPCGRLIKPFGDLEFEEAVGVFADIIKAAKGSAFDFILFETFSDSLETKAAVIAAKENCNLPIFVSNTYDEGSRLLTGTTPEAMCAMLEGLSVDAIGLNCSVGPAQMLKTARRLLEATSLPVFACPNAGFPRESDGKTVYDVGEEEFSDAMCEFVKLGVNAVGGCCGTTPAYIEKVVDKTKSIVPGRRVIKPKTVISSWADALYIGEKPLLIGERINPTGKPKLKDALRRNDFEYILKEALSQQEAGAHILDVNVGLPEIDEGSLMPETVCKIQAISELPLQLDTVNITALAGSLRIYNGKPLINSVNGKEKSMESVFPLAAKYGGAIIALTIDENGIPNSARERADIAHKIVKKAAEYGIDKHDIIVDPLALAVSSDVNSAMITLDSISLIKKELDVCVSLGVSNISFGLPQRDFVNGSFFALALERGLDLAIVNPLSFEMQKIYHTYLMLKGMDEGCKNYIAFASSAQFTNVKIDAVSDTKNSLTDSAGATKLEGLKKAIVDGITKSAAESAADMCKTLAPLDIINSEIIPALTYVGNEFEDKRMFLPQLLMSADAAKAAFEVIKERMPAGESEKGRIILATVRGDLHDIGKNIVKTVLQSYGYHVIDLGKDVKPETVLEAALKQNVKFVGLSALMTTTVPAMRDTIALLKENIPDIFVVVGGAVLNPECAKMIGADAYSKDAMASVRIADKFFGVQKN